MNNIDIYCSNMSKAMQDKLWFIKKMNNVLSRCTVYDFGCADGELIRQLAPAYPSSTFIGLDNSVEMLDKACKKQHFGNEMYLNSETLTTPFKNPTIPCVLIFSSVLHEIFSYENNPRQFLKNIVSKIDPDYIIIRDMLPMTTINRVADREDIDKIFAHKELHDMISEFTKYFGSLNRQKSLVHFLLKYRYVENWDREVKENYFPLMFEDISNSDLFENYRPIYQTSFIVPWIKKTIHDDFHIELTDNTHGKFILEKKSKWEL